MAIDPKKKKVLFLIEAFDKGGIEKVTLDIVNNLDPEKYEITVQTFWYGGHCQSLVNNNVHVVPFFFKRYIRGIIRLIQYLSPKLLYRLFVREDYDFEIAASDGGAAKVISGSTNKHAKKVCWVHMDVIARGSKLKEFQKIDSAKYIYGKFDQITCVSANALSRFIEKFGNYPKMNVAHNPIPVEEVQKKAGEKSPYEESKSIIKFVSVGRLAVEKGFDRLIKAVERLIHEGFTNFCVHIVGDGNLRESLEALVRNCDLEEYVHFEGFQDNPYPFIHYADFYICSSTDEAYPLTIGESLILGTPVIATDCSGTREWLGDSEYGMLIENSTYAIYEGMRSVLADFYNLSVKWKDACYRKTKNMTMESQMRLWSSIIFDGE